MTYGYFSKPTIRILNAHKPAWKKKNFDYFSAYSRRHFEQCEAISNMLIIHKEGGEYRWSWTKAEEFCDTARTPDGTRFVAHKSKRYKKITKAQMDKLKELGIVLSARKKPFTFKVLGKNQVQKLKNTFK